MVRRDSNSSMTERTFRSPSPGRPEAVPPAADAPPVPTIPESVSRGQRRSASVEPAMRISSPTPRKGGRHASVDMGAGRGQMAPAAAATPRPRPAELERESSLSRSVNFSRPMSPSAMTATAPLPAARPQSATGWFSSPKVGTGTPRNTVVNRPQSALAMSSTQARQLEHDIQDAANKPVLKKKKKVVQANEGERLTNGTMHTGPTGSAVQYTNPSSPTTNSTQAAPRAVAGDSTPVRKKKKKVVSSDTDDSEGPPPKNPARFSPAKEGDKSPISARAAGLLHKQPSVVREDPEAEHMAENDLSVMKRGAPGRSVSVKEPGRTVSTSEGPARAYIAPGGETRQRTVSLDIPRDMSQRNSSLTPPRNHAHFSDVIINTPANRFNPPGRSVSPFKSAMKHSPSSSIRNVSPAGLPNGSRGAVSGYASDTTSLASQDGASAGKKKKSARVSFDDGGTTITPPAAAATPNTSKPIRRELSPTAATDSDTDEVMTPRPALPSFGSVRGRKSQSPEQAEKVTETVNSSTSTSVATLPDRPEVTSDHALGAVFANDFAKRAQSNQQDSVPPQVTSVDGSGYASDSSLSSQEPVTLRKSLDEYHPAAEQPAAHNSKNDIISRVLAAPVVQTSASQAPSANLPRLPDISIQPATPGIEEGKPILDSAPDSASLYSMPGGWEESEGSKRSSTVSPRIEPIATEEPDFESSDEEESLEPPPMETERHSPLLEPTLDPIYESDSDNSDAFSDAAEDPSEFDLDPGFASLDAIMESPGQPRSPSFAASTPPGSPSTKLPLPRQPASHPSPLSSTSPTSADDGDWNQATAYWSSLTREKKDQMERLAQDDEVEAPVLQQPKPKKRTQAPAAISVPAPAPIRQSVEPSYEQPAPTLKKSMRAPPEPTSPNAGETHMRSSMRSGGGGGGMKSSLRPGSSGGMRTSMRQQQSPRSSVDEPRGALQKKRASAPSAGSLGAAAAATRKAPPTSPTKAYVAPPFTADDSDSESSFRKSRKRAGSASTVNSQGGGFSMKRSMRASSVDVSADRRAISPTPAPRGTGRMSVRSISPNGSFMGRNNMDTLRTSLRGGPVDDAPTMRGKNSKAMRDSKSPTRFSMSGFSKPAKPAPSTATSASKPTRMFKSRFADSDDEDEGAPSSGMGFSSRFADSDEEDSPVGPPRQMPTNLAPVRGIPRRSLQDDSTDLEDSDDDVRPSSNNKTKKASARVSKAPIVPAQSDIDAAMEIARRNVAAMNGGREPGVMPAEPQKQVRVDLEPQTNGTNGAIPPATPTKRTGFLGMLGRRRTSSVASVPQIPSNYFASPGVNGPQSPTGKLQRRTTTRANSSMSTTIPETPQTREGMLAEQQKASTPGGMSVNSQNWPLAPPGKVNTDGERPATSDGVELRKTMRGGGMVSRPPRPDLNRRSMSGGDLDRFDRTGGKADNKNGGVYSERTGKKKKFGFLRRAFGLND